MSLISLIQQHAQAEAAAGEGAGVAAILNAATVAVRNPKQWTLGEIEQTIGADAARTIAAAVKSAAAVDPLMESAFVALSTSGIQLHTDARQALIAAIGQQANLTAEQIAAMQSLGVTYASLAGQAGLGTVTADQCQQAWTQQAADIAYATAANEHINPALALAERTKASIAAALRAAADAVEAG